jgi:hypothetical protein
MGRSKTMQLIGTPAVLAPQTTGHPAALPEVLKRATPTKQVAQISDSTLTTQQHLPQTPQRPYHAGTPTAPPSALQIEIETMLAEQAEKLAKDKDETTYRQDAPEQRLALADIVPDADGQT